ncbi:MAG: class I SAM-dependent methyltransferase [Lentimicrobiaceae bacterium]|nr:class I SAM-dependent methyltransferase [Lentimicrobiaceae bacterium]
MKFFFMAWSYLKYKLKAKTKHAVHSPFVFDFITKVMEPHTFKEDYATIEKQVQVLQRNMNSIETVDFGATTANTGYARRLRRVSSIAKKAGIPRKQGRFLYRLIEYYQPEKMLEIGSSVGISTMYQAKANPAARLISIEGCASTAAYAQESVSAVNADNVKVLIGQFEHVLPIALLELEQLDYAFIDGNHNYSSTLAYFELLKQKARNGAVFVFHDIHWSPGMERAWEVIKSSEEVTITIDLFFMGLVFLKKELTPQHFILRF